VSVEDEHDIAGTEYAEGRRVAEFREWHARYRKAVAEGRELPEEETSEARLDKYISWKEEGTRASRRRVAMQESQAIDAALELLARHRYRVTGGPELEPPQEGSR
jgi:hypothetical protein